MCRKRSGRHAELGVGAFSEVSDAKHMHGGSSQSQVDSLSDSCCRSAMARSAVDRIYSKISAESNDSLKICARMTLAFISFAGFLADSKAPRS